MTSNVIFWFFGLTRPGIEPQSSRPLVNIQTIMPMARWKKCSRLSDPKLKRKNKKHFFKKPLKGSYNCTKKSRVTRKFSFQCREYAKRVALFSTLCCREGSYSFRGCNSFSRIAPVYSWSIPYNAEC